MGSPSTSSVATEQPTSPVPSLGTTRRPVHHYSCGVNPGVKAPDSCRTGTSCLHSKPTVGDSLGAVGACVHIARQSRMRSVVLENRSAPEHHSANLNLQRLPMKHRVAKRRTANTTLPWSKATKTKAFTNESAASCAPGRPAIVAKIARSTAPKTTADGRMTKMPNTAGGAFAQNRALCLLVGKRDMTPSVYHGGNATSPGYSGVEEVVFEPDCGCLVPVQRVEPWDCLA